MRLLRLEISGFKSFCDKISISFVQDGISIIVGPNGCGKSNVVDAIRWALGEQSAKHLRGASMEDVIFGGSSTRQPVSMAQVTLVFSNPSHDTLTKYAEFSEISVTRRLYRSGESQYLINKTPCRLADIRELFMDTGIGGKGYSIIEQGKIDQIVTSKADERRTIIDEAAGIVRFKAKRKDAERKFALTKQNLLRVEDVIAELQRQEESLKVQVEQAEKYLEKKARLERLQQCSAATKWFRLKEEEDKASKNKGKNLSALEDLQAVLAKFEADLATLKLDATRREAQKTETQALVQAKKEEIIKLESRLETDQAAIENLDEWQKKGEEESDLLLKQIKTVEYQIESHEKEKVRLAKEIEDNNALLHQFEAKEKTQNQLLSEQRQKLESLQKDELSVVTGLSKDQNQLSQINERLEELDQKENQLNAQHANLQAEAEKSGLSLDDIRAALTGKKEQKIRIQEQSETLVEAREGQTEKLEQLSRSLKELDQRQGQAENRLQSLNELMHSHESFDSATKKFLDYLDTHGEESANLGFRGTLAELVTPPVKTMPQATAFLNRYFNLLVFDSHKKLATIIDVVNQLEIEQLQLYFLDLVGPNTVDAAETTAWISARADLSIPVPLAGEFRMIRKPLQEVPAEELMNSNGLIDSDAVVMTKARIFLVGKPGTTNQAEMFFNRQPEIENLELELDQLLRHRDEKEDELAKEKQKLEELSKSLERYRKDLIELDLELVRLEKEADSKALESQRLNNSMAGIRSEQEQIAQSKTQFNENQEELTKAISDGERRKAEIHVEIEGCQQTIDGTVSDRKEFSDEVQHLRVSLAGLAEKQKNNDGILDRLKNDIVERNNQLDTIKSRAAETEGKREWYQTSIKRAKSSLPEFLDTLKQLENQLAGLKDQMERDKRRIEETQQAIQNEQQKMSAIKERNHKLDVRLAQLIQEATNISDNMFAENSVRPDEIIQTFDVRAFNLEAEAENIVQLRQSIGRMDDVNLAAKKEYDTLKERLDFLTTQSTDLEKSMEALENSIQKINHESRRRFRDTFKQINEHFGKLFPQLFGGGEAYLELTDESELLESGVEIIAKPPGKKLQNMTLLSGGEKALTAIALIFAIFQIKPSPFCLLDEVDAPLDEANNVRFNRHVKMLTENSQFIIITHNKKTMEIGNALFGVTMEEPGISKIVSVDFGRMPISA